MDILQEENLDCNILLRAYQQLPNCKKKSAAHKNGFEVLVSCLLRAFWSLFTFSIVEEGPSP